MLQYRSISFDKAHRELTGEFGVSPELQSFALATSLCQIGSPLSD